MGKSVSGRLHNTSLNKEDDDVLCPKRIGLDPTTHGQRAAI